MGVITARDLKQKTGDFIRRLRAGEPFVLTYRGRRIGVITPSIERSDAVAANADDEWAEVEAALEASEPAFDDWREATAWIRGRT
ncbi:MAG: type II toxin-antitoxin system prevent-host-death family antitoxin [Spirochaetaceae bacterium]|nr:type II toxin-antitoxin system prevent-host-death family antitoxin [Spirochaetaceae bacterium]